MEVSFKFKLNQNQFQQLLDSQEKIAAEIEQFRLKTTEGLTLVEKAISELLTPEPPPDDGIAVEGTIMARYKLNEDEVGADPGPKTFTIVGSGFKSKAGTAVGAADIDLSVELMGGTNMTASLANQRLSADGQSVEADVTIEGNATQATAELAVLKYSAKNRDTGSEVAADSDEFETGPGEASIGTIDSPVPLTEVITDGGGGGGDTGGGTGGGPIV